MRVVIRRRVHAAIKAFYGASILLHPALDRAIVHAKEKRLYDAIRGLENYAGIHPKARVMRRWIEAGYYELIVEDFHFGYSIEQTSKGESLVIVQDAVHSLLNHDETINEVNQN